MTRPIAAFSMEDYERLTRTDYQAAEFRRGKDKKKRKSRSALATAGMVAGGLGAAGALAGGIRYGMAGAKESGYKDTRYYKKGMPVKAGSLEDRARKFGSGASSQVSRDIDSAKKFGKGVGQGLTNAKTQAAMGMKDARYYAGQGIDRTKASGSRAMDALKSGKGLGKLSGAWKSGAVGKAGLVGAGLATAGALAAGGYAGYRALNKNKKKK